MLRRSFLLCLLLLSGVVHAATIEEPLPIAAQENMARDIFHELKCVVCEGQSLADSDAVLARQMRSLVRDMVAEGKSRDQVFSFFRERYGDQILMTPPMQASTLLLWLAPFLLGFLGGLMLWRTTRHGGAK